MLGQPVGVRQTAQPGAVVQIGATPAVEAHPTIVQSLGNGALGGALISIAATPNAAAVGDLVIVAFAWASATSSLSTVTDTSGNTWTVVPTNAASAEEGGYGVCIVTTGWASGANTVTGTLASGAPGGRVWAAASIAAAYSPVVDSHTETATTTDHVSITSSALAQADSVAIITDLTRALNSVLPSYTNTWINGFGVVSTVNGSAIPSSGVAIASYDNRTGQTGAITGGFPELNAASPHGTGILVVKVNLSPRPQQLVQTQDQATFYLAAQKNRARASHIIQPAVQLAAASAPAAPTVTPLILPHVQALIPSGGQRRHVHGAVIASDVQASAAPSQPKPNQVVVGQAEQMAVRRAHHGSVVQSRWPGYEWAGLAPVTPTPRQVVQDQAAVWQARQDHRRGLVVEPGVQAAAAAAGAAPVTPPLPKQVVQDQAALSRRRQQHAGRVVQPSVQLAAASAPAAPVTTPLPRQIVILARATPRQARSGHVIQPRMLQAPVAPPRTVNVIDLCPATTRRQRGGHVVVGRPVTQPVTPRRPQPIRPVSQRRPRRGQVVRQGPQMAAFGTVTPPSSLISQAALTGYPTGTPAQDGVAAGSTGHPAVGATGDPVTGATGQPHVGGTGTVNL